MSRDIKINVEDSGEITYSGSGSIFNISDDITTGALMNVNDISGLPVLTVHDDGEIKLGNMMDQSKVVMCDENGNEWYLKIEKESLCIEPKNKEKLREWKLKNLIDGDN